jgi:hypothetical protein
MWKTYRSASRSGPVILLPPPVDRIPPHQAQPLVHTGLCPLPVGPPSSSKLGFVARRRGGKRGSMNLMAENAQRTAGMEVGGHDQDRLWAYTHASQARFRVMRLIPGRKPRNRANFDARRLREALHIPPRQLNFCKTASLGVRRNIDHQAPPVTLVQEFQRALRTMLRLPGQHQNHIRAHWSIEDQKPPSIRRQSRHSCHNRNRHQDSPSAHSPRHLASVSFRNAWE